LSISEEKTGQTHGSSLRKITSSSAEQEYQKIGESDQGTVRAST